MSEGQQDGQAQAAGGDGGRCRRCCGCGAVNAVCKWCACAVTLRRRSEYGQVTVQDDHDDCDDRRGMIANIQSILEYSFLICLISLLARTLEPPQRGAAAALWSCKLGPVPRLAPL